MSTILVIQENSIIMADKIFLSSPVLRIFSCPILSELIFKLFMINFNRHDDGLKWKGTKWDYIKVLRVPSQEVYNPDIMIYNTVDYNKRKIENTNVLLYPNGLVMWVPPATHKIACNLNLKRWPYDEHICFIKFGSWTYDGYVLDVDYISKQYPGVGNDFFPGGSRGVLGPRAQGGYQGVDFGTQKLTKISNSA